VVGSTAADTLLPFLLIAKGTTHGALDKFVKQQPGFKVRAGGAAKADASATAKVRYTHEGGDKKQPLAATPPFYYDEQSGHIVCAGDSSHWINASTQRLWVSSVVWPAHVRACKAVGLDPKQAKSILHFDAYPVHIAKEFIEWMKAEYPQLILVYVPANCTSKMQIADVVLNRPLKSDYTNQQVQFLVLQCREQMANGRSAAQVKWCRSAQALLWAGC
jgi:DDE superfamily endonuclease